MYVYVEPAPVADLCLPQLCLAAAVSNFPAPRSFEPDITSRCTVEGLSRDQGRWVGLHGIIDLTGRWNWGRQGKGIRQM